MDDLHPELFAPSQLLLAPERMLLRTGCESGQALVVREGVIADVGAREAVCARNPDLTARDLPGRLVMPGFIDAHHHLTQSFGKALAFGEPSEIFRRIWIPLVGFLDENAVYLASKLAALESLRGGFTAVVDAGTRSEADVAAVARATQEAGLRCVLGLICNDTGPGRDREAILRAAEAHLARWPAGGLVHPSLAISIPEAATDAMLHRVSHLAAEAGALFQTHVNEHLAAVERSLVERGLRPLEHLAAADALGPHVLIAHATLVTPAELKLLARTDTAVAYNPVASTWKGNAVAPAVLMDELGIRFAIGTDGTRSDAFRMIEAAETVQRIAFGLAVGDSSCGGGWTWLDHATHGAADAVGLKGRDGERRGYPAGRYRRSGVHPVVGPGLGARSLREPGSDRSGAGRGQAAPVAGLADRLGRTRAAARSARSGGEGGRRRTDQAHSPDLARASRPTPAPQRYLRLA